MIPEEHLKTVLDFAKEEGNKRTTLLIRVVGAHSHGFASVDSDIDLIGIHTIDPKEFLGLGNPTLTVKRMETVNGVEMDFNSYEIKMMAEKILAGKGNFLEALCGKGTPVWLNGEDWKQLQELAIRNLSKKYYNHYRGFAYGQSKKIEATETPTVKSILYVIRLCLTGANLLARREVETNLLHLSDRYNLVGVDDLIEAKSTEKTTDISPDLLEKAKQLMTKSFDVLDNCHKDSYLPETPPAHEDMENFVVDFRRSILF